LDATLSPEAVAPVDFLQMVTDPSTAICDPKLISRGIRTRNLTSEQLEVREKEEVLLAQPVSDERTSPSRERPAKKWPFQG